MAYSVGTLQSTVSSSSSVSTLDSPNFTAVAGDCLIAFVQWEVIAAVLSLSDIVGSNDGWIHVAACDFTSGVRESECWILPNCAAGSCTIRATFSVNPANFPTIVIIPVSGIAADPDEVGITNNQSVPGTATDAVTSGSITPTYTGGAAAGVFGIVRNNSSANFPAAGTGMTDLGTIGTRVRVQHHRVTSGATASTFTNTGASGDDHFTTAVTLNEDASVPTPLSLVTSKSNYSM